MTEKKESNNNSESETWAIIPVSRNDAQERGKTKGTKVIDSRGHR